MPNRLYFERLREARTRGFPSDRELRHWRVHGADGRTYLLNKKIETLNGFIDGNIYRTHHHRFGDIFMDVHHRTQAPKFEELKTQARRMGFENPGGRLTKQNLQNYIDEHTSSKILTRSVRRARDRQRRRRVFRQIQHGAGRRITWDETTTVDEVNAMDLEMVKHHVGDPAFRTQKFSMSLKKDIFMKKGISLDVANRLFQIMIEKMKAEGGVQEGDRVHFYLYADNLVKNVNIAINPFDADAPNKVAEGVVKF